MQELLEFFDHHPGEDSWGITNPNGIIVYL
jgi:hypothetical protein